MSDTSLDKLMACEKAQLTPPVVAQNDLQRVALEVEALKTLQHQHISRLYQVRANPALARGSARRCLGMYGVVLAALWCVAVMTCTRTYCDDESGASSPNI